MNELRKYATFSVDIIGKPIKVNSMFSFGRARIFYLGTNPNRSIIEGEAAEKLAASIPGTPIIGLYNYETEDFEGHGEGQSAYGFVPLEPNPEWVKVDEEGREREYLEVDVVVWDGRFEEAKNILSDAKSLSMELNPATMKGTMVRHGDHMYYKITNAEFAGITVLGEDVEPCFKDAGFLNAYSHMVNEYAKYMNNIQKNEEGGINQMENIEEVKVDEVVEPEVNTNEETETEVVVDEVSPEAEVEAEKPATEDEVVEETIETEEQPAEDVSSEKAPAEEEVESDNKDNAEEKDEEHEEILEEDNHENENEDGQDDKFSLMETEMADLKAENESLKEELNAAQEALKKYTRKEKLDIISKFSKKLENYELVEDLTNKVDDLTKEEIKAELGNALVEQIEAEEPEEDEDKDENNFSLNIQPNEDLGNSAWDLVKRYKQNK